VTPDAIAVATVSHAYARPEGPVKTLNAVSLGVRKGELLCLIGPSGCGKSTLLNIIGGLVAPIDGEVRVNGHPVHGPTPREIAYVFQENTLFPWNTILDNITVGLEFQGVPAAERRERAMDAIEAVGLTDFANNYPHQLSGGMKQRASLARALSLRTDILLMDEPFAALDEQTRMTMGHELLKIWSETSKTVVFITHSLTEAVYLADEVLVMSARPGRIIDRVAIELPRPRTYEMMATDVFGRLRERIWHQIRVAT